jgi:hypothetical protein
MDGWQVALLVSAVVFAAFMVFKMRPAITSDGRASAEALETAKRRIEAAKTDGERVAALADAGDACARLGRINGAIGFYSRALRLGPTPETVVRRAASALARRPNALELLMWRHLAAHPWVDDHRTSATAALRVLVDVYGRRHRHQVRQKALEHALLALGEGLPKSE